MGDRERLIELLEQHCLLRHDVLECSAGKEIAECSDCLANWLIENGVILPPCKVGDTVYFKSEYVHKVFSDTVENIRIQRSGITVHTVANNHLWGDEVFLTREEAERALKGGEE